MESTLRDKCESLTAHLNESLKKQEEMTARALAAEAGLGDVLRENQDVSHRLLAFDPVTKSHTTPRMSVLRDSRCTMR